jgi:hypothetical protein
MWLAQTLQDPEIFRKRLDSESLLGHPSQSVVPVGPGPNAFREPSRRTDADGDAHFPRRPPGGGHFQPNHRSLGIEHKPRQETFYP